MTRLWPLVVLLAFLTPVPAAAVSEFQGEVVSVLDGDTIEVLHNNHAERIHLNGIDCPEKGQAYGKRAKQAASALAFGKEVTLQTHGLDKYGRTFADVLLPNGTNVNHELVKEGWCWWYRKYAPGNIELEILEKDARDAKRGLWVSLRLSHRGSTGKQNEGRRSTCLLSYLWTLLREAACFHNPSTIRRPA